MANTQAYYDAVTITAIKRLGVQVPAYLFKALWLVYIGKVSLVKLSATSTDHDSPWPPLGSATQIGSFCLSRITQGGQGKSRSDCHVTLSMAALP